MYLRHPHIPERPLTHLEVIAVRYARSNSDADHSALWNACMDNARVYGGDNRSVFALYSTWAWNFESYCH